MEHERIIFDEDVRALAWGQYGVTRHGRHARASIGEQEIARYNQDNNIDASVLLNGRRMTNLGVYRKYIEHYLKNHPGIKQDMTVMVRQLANENKGIPIEIYCFTNTTAWVAYESIQADIFDHLYATAAFFDLEIFQEPSGRNFTDAFSTTREQTSL